MLTLDWTAGILPALEFEHVFGVVLSRDGQRRVCGDCLMRSRTTSKSSLEIRQPWEQIGSTAPKYELVREKEFSQNVVNPSGNPGWAVPAGRRRSS